MKKRKILAAVLALMLAAGCGQGQVGNKDVNNNVNSNEASLQGQTGDAQGGSDTAGGLADQNTTGAAKEESEENAGKDLVIPTGTPIADMFTKRDKKAEYDENTAIHITLTGSSAEADKTAVDSGTVTISGSMVTITKEGTYVISGTLENGSILVDAPETAKIQLVLAGAQIHNESSAAVYVKNADKVFVTLEAGTENTISNGGSFPEKGEGETNIDAALFSKQDLTLNGEGSLTVASPAGHGITGKDDLVITGGIYHITAASHGLEANDSIRIAEASITIDAGKDAIHADNSEDTTKGFVYVENGVFSLEAEGDAISASADLTISGGVFELLAGGGSENGTKASSDSWGGFGGGFGGNFGGGNFGGGFGGGRPGGRFPGEENNRTDTGAGTDPKEGTDTVAEEESTSMKGLKSGGNLVVTGGLFNINSADDGVHSNASATINGGSFEIETGDDGVHAEETLTVTGGNILITESYEGLEAFHIVVSGGTVDLTASDDGLNAAGGTDSSGTTGGRDGMFGGGFGGFGGGQGGFGGGFMSANSDGSILISGGNIAINASGDGIDANGTLEITGGFTTVTGPTQGDTATLDYDVSGTISGGTFIGTGAKNMAQSFSESEQGVVAVSVGSQAAGTKITLLNADGKEILTCTPELDYQIVIISCPELVKGESCQLMIGDQTATLEIN